MLDHDLAHIGPQGESPTSYVIRNNFREKYGENLLVPCRDDKELAYARIVENIFSFVDSSAAVHSACGCGKPGTEDWL